MRSTARRSAARPLRLNWKIFFAVSFLLGAAILSSTLSRESDGDDAMTFYEAGLRSWHDVAVMSILPPGTFEIAKLPQVSGMLVPEHPVFLYDRWRPIGSFLIPKLLWSLNLPHDVYRVLNWFMCWLSAWALAWGMVRTLSLAIELPEDAQWILASLIWWSPALLFTSSSPFYSVHYPFLYFGLAIGLFSDLGPAKSSTRRGRIAGGVLFSYLAFQTHENSWWLFSWYFAWLAGLAWLGRSDRLSTAAQKSVRARAIPFWVPPALILAHILIYRSFSPDHGTDWGRHGGVTTDAAWVISNAGYFFLAVLHGLSAPLSHWLRADDLTLDVTAAEFPVAFLLTLAGIAALIFPRRPAGSFTVKQKLPVVLALVLSCGVLGMSIVPYLGMKGHRFVHYTALAELFSAVIFLVGSSERVAKTVRFRQLPLLLMLAACMLTSVQYIRGANWLDYNVKNAHDFTVAALAYPGMKDCTVAEPCCVKMSQRTWGANEWVLSWNANAGNRPVYYPDIWPGAVCARQIDIN